jgi:acyl dehydratase
MNAEDLAGRLGTTLGTSHWVEIGQDRIDRFADVTEDWQFIHLDPERAAQTAFGGTVAHGYLTLSMLSAMAYDVLPRIDGMRASANYGFDRVRFLAPVRAGSRLRARFDLVDVMPRGEDRLLVRLAVTMEIEGQESLALSADWLVMYLF